jgi:molecular chaperone HscB
MTCPSCQRDPGTGPLCAGCGALQPLPPALDAFTALGLKKTFFLDPKLVEERFKELNRRLHPDRFAQRAARERRLSLEWTTAVNDAARTLKDPLRRASYLLKARGIDLDKESGPGAMSRLPPDFLEEVLEIREGFAEARAARDLERVRALAQKVEEQTRRVEAELRSAFERLESPHQGTAGGAASGRSIGLESEPLDQAAAAVAVLKYHARFDEELEAFELSMLEEG